MYIYIYIYIYIILYIYILYYIYIYIYILYIYIYYILYIYIKFVFVLKFLNWFLKNMQADKCFESIPGLCTQFEFFVLLQKMTERLAFNEEKFV